MEPRAALARAVEHYTTVLALVTATQWDEPSTCPGWTVKDLADHVLAGNRFAIALLAGHPAEVALRAASGDGFDGDPEEEFVISAAAQATAFETTGPLDRTLEHPNGEISARVFLGFRVGEVLLHSWDLAGSIRRQVEPDAELVAQVWNTPQQFDAEHARPGQFAAAPDRPLPDGAAVLDRLLAAAGRGARPGSGG